MGDGEELPDLIPDKLDHLPVHAPAYSKCTIIGNPAPLSALLYRPQKSRGDNTHTESTHLDAPQDAPKPRAERSVSVTEYYATPEATIDIQIKLSALWLFILLNIVFRDIHQFAL